ncbi:hypothetical protein VP1G_10660 [Cytospora mali]|uniref:Uncharacterized protein n=1 Tax=Cytospora mali TaxID=578113 RepID=A0A194URC2_CYTMA|nr:hypothetical protein VP1G_10660 [Valsa mali var. pyri (nom. inval.)]
MTFGGDWFQMDADGKHGRVNFRGIAQTEYLVADPKLRFLESSFIVGSAQVLGHENGVNIQNRQSLVITPKVSE